MCNNEKLISPRANLFVRLLMQKTARAKLREVLFGCNWCKLGIVEKKWTERNITNCIFCLVKKGRRQGEGRWKLSERGWAERIFHMLTWTEIMSLSMNKEYSCSQRIRNEVSREYNCYRKNVAMFHFPNDWL